MMYTEVVAAAVAVAAAEMENTIVLHLYKKSLIKYILRKKGKVSILFQIYLVDKNRNKEISILVLTTFSKMIQKISSKINVVQISLPSILCLKSYKEMSILNVSVIDIASEHLKRQLIRNYYRNKF